MSDDKYEKGYQDREDFALGHGEQFVHDRAEAEAELAAGKTYALEDVAAKDEHLEQIKERWAQRRKALPEAAADIDWLIAEVERPLEVVFTADPVGLEDRLDLLMEALVDAGVPAPAISATLSTGEVRLMLGR